MTYTDAEARARKSILEKDKALRLYLAAHRLDEGDGPPEWLAYLAGLKNLLGNVSNDLGFVATLLVKRYAAAKWLGCCASGVSAMSRDSGRGRSERPA